MDLYSLETVPTSSWPSAKQEEVVSIEVEVLVWVQHSNKAAEAEEIITGSQVLTCTQREPYVVSGESPLHMVITYALTCYEHNQTSFPHGLGMQLNPIPRRYV